MARLAFLKSFRSNLQGLEDDDLLAMIGETLKFKPHLCSQVMELAADHEMQNQAAASALPGSDAEGEAEQRFLGTLKSFSSKSSYGFIACEELFESYGCDVFLPGSALTVDLEVGAQVSFSAHLNKDGKPQALDVLPISKVAGSGRSQLSASGVVKTQQCRYFALGQCSKGEACTFIHEGTLSSKVSFTPCIFFAQGDCTKGDACTFLHDGDNPPALALSASGTGVEAPAPEMLAQKIERGHKFHGMIKSYVAKSSYGFIACEELRDGFGADVFLPASALNMEPEVGAHVSFTVHLNKQGKPQASDVRPTNAAPSQVAAPSTFKTQVCRFFALGQCSKGGACTYSHEEGVISKARFTPCTFFAQGECTKGEACTFLHDGDSPPALSASAAGVAAPVEMLAQKIERGHRFMGIIKSYVAKSSYGFIACEELFAFFGADVFLAASALNMEPEVGAHVSFIVQLNKESKPQASDVWPTSQMANAAPNQFAAPIPFKTQPCRFFAVGQCSKGEACTFSHEDPNRGVKRKGGHSVW